MVVYLLLSCHDYEGCSVSGIFSTRRKAEKATIGVIGVDREPIRIIKWEVDVGEVPPRKKIMSKDDLEIWKKRWLDVHSPFLKRSAEKLSSIMDGPQWAHEKKKYSEK